MAYESIRRRTVASVEKKIWIDDALPYGLMKRYLNSDSETGATTLIVDIPPGWSMPATANQSALEILVLDGQFTSGNRTFAKGHYAFLPPAVPFGEISTTDGASILLWHEGPIGAVSAEDWDPTSSAVETLDVFNPSNWKDLREAFSEIDTSSHDRVNVAAKCIRLRTYEETAGDTILFVMAKGFKKPELEVHESAEEVLTLSGILSTDPDHVYEPGEYFCWAPNVVHGPVAGWDAICISKHHGRFTSPKVPVSEA